VDENILNTVVVSKSHDFPAPVFLKHKPKITGVAFSNFSGVVCTYGLLTKCQVKMAGSWPSSFFACLWTETNKLAKKERGQYPAILTEQTWSITDLLYGFRENYSCGTRRVVPGGQDGSIFPALVANHSAGFASSCPLAELAIQ